jgi:hypothetical protein
LEAVVEDDSVWLPGLRRLEPGLDPTPDAVPPLSDLAVQKSLNGLKLR